MSKLELYGAIDTETTGVDSTGSDVLLQVAAFVTDRSYNVLDDEGIEMVAKFSPEEVQSMYDNAIPYVQEMHTRTGLWDRLSGPDAVTFDVMDARLSEYLLSFEADEMYMLGNSITLDRNFMSRFLPESFKVLHYRSLDVTSIRLFLEEKYGKSKLFYREAAEGDNVHEARYDILASLAQVRYYRSLGE